MKKAKKKGKAIKLTLITLIITAAFVGVLSLSLDSRADEIRANTESSVSATNFVKKASMGNLYEVEASKVAIEKTGNKSVREFAQHMVEEHGKADKDLRAIIGSTSAEQMALPEELDDAHKAKLAKLQPLSGVDFDKAYIADMRAGHADAVSLFSDYSKNGSDKVLKNYATITLPKLEEHNRRVQKLESY